MITWKLSCAGCGWKAYRQSETMKQNARCPDCKELLKQEVFKHTALANQHGHGL